ncbi:unnamed protein product [Agarophyton chilense]|eukprot:gb/GEZJ01000598.1/.p1 GENE.gb/GEZJ01000598.1/~~gb/GEZJ01000598.1/.p1  ORF type:complete len:676 (-),score=96.12 gb/GEZJ01000598.1/:1748-3775(-)
MSHKPAVNGAVPGSELDRYAPNSSLPLLVRLPDGEDHQVDIPSNASIKDLKTSIANLPWQPSGTDPQEQSLELEFGGETLNDNRNLSHYNIPEVYDHADGFLKTISDSGYLDPDKKVEALDKACAVVRGISRGEKDMERLISAVFDDINDDTPASPSAQPSLRNMRRSRISRIPSLNIGALNPLGLDGKPSAKLFSPSAPPTPRQLIRKLSLMRPDLYDSAAADKATSSLSLGNIANLENNVQTRTSDSQPLGSGELKRGNTWFHDFVTSINTTVRDPRKRTLGHENEIEGDSEGEDGMGTDEGADEGSASTDDRKSPSSKNSGELGMGNIQKQRSSVSGEKGGSESEAASVKEEKSFSESVHKPEGNTVTAMTSASMDRRGSKPEADAGSTTTNLSKKDFEEPEKKDVGRNTTDPPNANTQTPPRQPTPSSDAHAITPARPIRNQDKQVIGLTPERQTTVDDAKQPRKRGRKRKNPHLTEEQRKAQRQAQNRESAKLSRIRRKHMTMEYERRVNTLEGENENLRDTISGLEDRLQMLQNLLTITVQRRAIPQVHPSMMPTSTAAMGPGPHNRLNPSINPHMPIVGQPGVASQAAIVSRALNAQALMGNQNMMARPGGAPHAGMVQAQNVLNAQRQVNANDALVGRTQAHSGPRSLGPNAPSRSNPVTNFRYKNF